MRGGGGDTGAFLMAEAFRHLTGSVVRGKCVSCSKWKSVSGSLLELRNM